MISLLLVTTYWTLLWLLFQRLSDSQLLNRTKVSTPLTSEEFLNQLLESRILWVLNSWNTLAEATESLVVKTVNKENNTVTYWGSGNYISITLSKNSYGRATAFYYNASLKDSSDFEEFSCPKLFNLVMEDLKD